MHAGNPALPPADCGLFLCRKLTLYVIGLVCIIMSRRKQVFCLICRSLNISRACEEKLRHTIAKYGSARKTNLILKGRKAEINVLFRFIGQVIIC